ncbi:DUF5606 domain-containing protein [Mangrovimonas sp. TPBH4]|uniref:DUF5606 family protein n=1 Tax=Mangrovimonas sp. TPBH4 TaxID=1645914 RepID=UPI0006B692B1|nr:DUF5606 domain-containing protein [Mangrovimonas sp. TPBH4]
MGLDKILSISGKPGLYKIVTQTRNGIIAESLIDSKRISVNVHNNISVLSEIAVYTLTEELPLFKVFEKIMEKEEGKATSISHKDGKEALEEYFFGILPDYDEDRVYASDIKKIVQWYNLLQSNDMLAAVEETSKAVAEAEAASEEE